MNNESSSTNTDLIVIVLLLLVGFGVWWFARTPAPATTEDTGGGIEIEVNGGTGETPSETPAN